MNNNVKLKKFYLLLSDRVKYDIRYFPVKMNLKHIKDYPMEFQEYYKIKKYFKLSYLSEEFLIYFNLNYETLQLIQQKQCSFDKVIFTICKNKKNNKLCILEELSGEWYSSREFINLNDIEQKIQTVINEISTIESSLKTEHNPTLKCHLQFYRYNLEALNKVKPVFLTYQNS